jgi:hypothetical protein
MKIPASDARWASVAAPYASSLPPASVDKGKVVPALAALTEDGCVAAVIRDGAQLGARIGRVVAATTGWPAPRIAKLDALAEGAAAIIPSGEVTEALRAGVTFGAKIIVGQALSILDDALAGITGIPILGWIFGIGRAVWGIVDAARTRAPEIAAAMALAYDRDADSSAAQHVLDLAAGKDWSPIFMPPKGPFGRERLAYTATGIADGDAWGQISGVSYGSIGALPGVAEIAGYWQSPRHLLGSSREAGRESIQSAATLLPSTTSLCGQLWCALQTGGLATTGRVDFKAIADAWRDYTFALENFAGATRGGGDPTKPPPSHAHEWLSDQIIRGWSWDIAGMTPFYGLQRDKIPKAYRVGLLDRIVAWRCAEAREATRRAWQTTPSVAYVPEGAPALADPVLMHAWKFNRRAMINKASRRIGLDLELVPPGEYRDELATRPIPEGKGGSTNGTAPLGVAQALPGSGTGGGKSGGGGGTLVAAGLGIGALAAGAAMLRR